MLTLKVATNSEIGRKIRTADAAGEPLLVDTGDTVYTLQVQKREQATSRDIWANYDPEKVRAALRESAGALRGVDIEQLKADLREEREQDSVGRPAQ